ncbi:MULTISPECIES: isopentenyl-diphosphate Delta-isomerase [Pseudomonas]|uniref:isopentenyl-diphosphate Delta-isomerase n=1 Tax=Pseudomonas TaxID=286 RepID=UPI001B322D8F|nr:MULTISPECIES: isopentenyl-diphosphate Delta-isomerase [Pseudomonas]MBP5970290.1 isopentenyl-diphosphate Delta-isomerase [Pseudomonas iridis]UHC81897.1 isopentenyl-diphosphate Delta-isomerase [Pseudomonas sp. NIBR-H-19]
MDMITLVDEQDTPVGCAEKMEVHRRGLLHRAFSIFIFNREGHLLLQRRALCKYHPQGLWTNACCGHPRPGESTAVAAKRRLYEEMGLVCQALVEVHAFLYRTLVSNELTEFEYDHVLVGGSSVDPMANPDEVLDWEWVTLTDLERDISDHPEKYTVWFQKIFQQQGIAKLNEWGNLVFAPVISQEGSQPACSIQSTKHLNRLD